MDITEKPGGEMDFRRVVAGLALAWVATPSVAQTAELPDFFSSWFAMATRTQAEQPRWMTPLVTVTPRLEQEFRFDFFSETLNNHAHLDNYGAGKGVEIIPSERTEII